MEKVCKEYGNQLILKDVSLRVEKGERVALIGPNGAGKTTLLKIAMGLEIGDRGSVIIARNTRIGYLSQYIDDNQIVDSAKATATNYEKVSQLEQKLRLLEKKLSSDDPGSQDYERHLQNYEKTLARFEAIDGYNVEVKLKRTLYHLGLRMEALTTPIAKLSGGERMRAAVARIMLEEPDLLLLDEPTNHLDIKATEWFEAFLKGFQGGVLFVSHDRYFLNQIATRVAELDNATITVRGGSYSDYIKHKQQLTDFVSSQQQRLKWTLKKEDKIIQGLKSQRKSKAVISRKRRVAKLRSELNNTLSQTKAEAHLFRDTGPKIKFKKIQHLSRRIAWAENLRKDFGSVTLFSDVNFSINGGDRVGIIGPNGCGKTTLINMLLGKDKNYQGTIELGTWVKYVYMGQEVLFDNPNNTIFQFILAEKTMSSLDARNHLARFQFYGEAVDKKISVLSGGERVRLYLAAAMLKNPDCFILDEPTNHLDMLAREAVEKALQEFNGTIIAITHERQYLTNCVDKILEIEDGKLKTYEGNYEHYKKLKSEIETEIAKPIIPKKSYRGRQKSKSLPKVQQVNKNLEKVQDEILVLEAKVKEMEESFTESSSTDEYEEYGQLLEKIDVLYQEWSMMMEE